MGKKIRVYLGLFLYVLALLYLGFEVNRSDFYALFGAYSVAFVCYCFALRSGQTVFTTKKLLLLGILIRLVLCFAFPRLSDDIYRFFWDGKLICNGYNPFAYLPSYFMEQKIFTDIFDTSLFQKLNSPNYYSIYPPICQVVFAASYWFFPNNIYAAAVLMKLFLWACEVGTVFLLWKKYNTLKISPNAVLFYVLNPLCIVEICGNLHFEGAMIFFFLLFLVYQYKKIGPLFYALSVCSKLLTLIFLPVFCIILLKEKRWKSLFFLGFSTIFLVILFFLPLIDGAFIANFSNSLNLYFQKFEFNASLYYLGKVVGTWIKGYNPMQYVSGTLSAFVLFNILLQSLRKTTLWEKLFWVFLVYLLCQTIVHPWYLTTLVLLATLTKNWTGIAWSALVFLSYSHYQGGVYQEHFSLLIIEYVGVFAFMIWNFSSSLKQDLSRS